MNVIDGTGDIVPEPDWESLFTDVLEVNQAREHWRTITVELKDRQLLSPSNSHALQRLVVAYVLYDRSLREVAEQGAVMKPRRGNSKAIARTSPHFSAMRELSSDAMALEAEFGLAPRRRASAGKVQNGKQKPRAADRFLRQVS